MKSLLNFDIGGVTLQNIRNFFIAFGVSLVVFFVIAFVIINKLIPDTDNPNEIDSNNNDIGNVIEVSGDNPDAEIMGNSFTALLACSDDLTGRFDALMLVHVDKENKEYMISSLPSYMVLNIDSIEYYLGDLNVEKGNSFLLNKVYAVTGLKVDYYAFISLGGFAGIIDEIGGVTFTIPENMYFKDVNDKVLVNLQKGTKKLSGNEALQLMRYNGYADGDEKRRSVQREFLLTAFDNILKIENIDIAPGIFDKLVKYTNTNFTATDFISNIDLIFSYGKFEKNEVDYPGVSTEYDGVARFIPMIDEAISIYKEHR